MDRKPKYSLFPTKPSPPPREPLPSLPEGHLPPPHSQEKLPPTPQDPLPPLPQEPLTPLAEESLTHWPPLNKSRSSSGDTSSALKEPTFRTEEAAPERKMHTPSSSTSSETSFHKSTAASPPSSQPPNSRNRPRTVYFHSGLGGAGNYHKAIREDNVLRPMISNRPSHPRFLSSLFGSLGSKRGRRQQQQYPTSNSTGSSQSSSQALPLGAAEVIRRKMLGYGSEGKPGSNGTRS